MSARLRRGDVTYAKGAALAGATAADVRLKVLRQVPKGRYELELTATAKDGSATTVRRIANVT